jgi:peptide/nickel transport system permease protein
MGGGALAAVALAAILAPWIAPHDPRALAGPSFAPPGPAFWLGTDNLGHDVLSEILYGAQVSLAVGILAAASSTLIGVAMGAVAGFAGGGVDALLMRTTEFFQIVPRFFLALIIIALSGPGLAKTIFVIAILGWPAVARLVRGEFLRLRTYEFVEAARAVGASPFVIITREILPNAVAPAVVAGSLDVAQAILLEAGLSFFGLGDPNHVSWGMMINTAQSFLGEAWWLSTFPGLAILITVLSVNLVGDGLNDALNPRSAQR